MTMITSTRCCRMLTHGMARTSTARSWSTTTVAKALTGPKPPSGSGHAAAVKTAASVVPIQTWSSLSLKKRHGDFTRRRLVSTTSVGAGATLTNTVRNNKLKTTETTPKLASGTNGARMVAVSASAIAVSAIMAAMFMTNSSSSTKSENENYVSSMLAKLTATATTTTAKSTVALAEGGHVNKRKQRSKKDGRNRSESDDEELFENQCLKRQMYVPKVPYPAWDYSWDGNMLELRTDLDAFKNQRVIPTSTKTRHILLIRHGQYDETFPEDSKRKLTKLGIEQAKYTGKRLKEIIEGSEFDNDDVHDTNEIRVSQRGKCFVKAIHSSDMTRAKETADIIQSYLPKSIYRSQPDPLLNETLPAPMIPIRPDIRNATEEIDQNHNRVEKAFHKYCYRDMPNNNSTDKNDTETKSDEIDTNTNIRCNNNEEEDDDDSNNEFEILVCHGNVIRYIFCRALQLPPEAWLRYSILNCSITYLVVRPDGIVCARMLGDIGHMPYDHYTFSGYHGLKW